MKEKKNCPVRISEPTKNRLKNFKRQLEVIENDDVSLGEIIDRMSKGEDMLTRLKFGSLERKGKRT